MSTLPHEIERLGPEVQSWVETQLLTDLNHYGVTGSNLHFDWSDACQEGHWTNYRGRMLESLSGVAVFDSGAIVAQGWFDFVVTSKMDGTAPVLFWLFLSIRDGRHGMKEAKKDAFLPDHVWNRLSTDEKTFIAATESKWLKRDPKVQQWQRNGTS